MSTDVAELEARIRELSHAEKSELLRALIAELDGPAEAGVEEAWVREARRRRREIVEGEVKAVPGSQVFERLRSRLQK